MAYNLPVFNLTCRITTDYESPNEGPTWLATIMCQKYVPTKIAPQTAQLAGYTYPAFVTMRFEPVGFYALFDQARPWEWSMSFLELNPPGSEIYYRIYSWEIAHQGFPNEYPFAYCCLCDHTDWALFLTSGSSNDNAFPAGFKYAMGPIHP